MTEVLAVVVSRYPALSHAFIRREVEALRRSGVRVVTASLRKPAPAELLTDADRRERDDTFYVLPARAGALLRNHGRALLGRPRRTLATLGLAWSQRGPGPRGALWALFHFAEAIQLSGELERLGVTHVHAHFANAGGSVALLASSFLGVGFSLTLHGLSDFGDPRGQRIADKIARARFVVCVSEHGREQARAIAPSAASRIHVVRCGLGPEAFREHGPNRQHEPNREHEPEGEQKPEGERDPAAPAGGGEAPLRLISVGRLAPEKAHTDLVAAVARLRTRGLEVGLRLIGEGPERARIEDAVRKAGLEDRVSLPGPLGGDALRDELARSDLFVLSSRMEGLPVTLMEALAVGTPVVAPSLAGIPELVRDGRDGFLFPTGDVAALAEVLERACADRSRLAALGRSGRERVRELHDVDRNAAGLRALIDASHAATPVAAAQGRE